MAGESIAAPLAKPPTSAVCPSRSAAWSVSFRTVSVVRMASAAACPPAASAESCWASFGTPDSTGSIGMGMPMRPV